ncbi:SRPBCC family protein [Streptomyces sp. NPDC089799]|uniref:aromatase/cyclase n=1 Tax=Streptomyces sp. NPDC089799 TaxID=3155066 RepID=UPI00342EBF44
MAQTNDAHPAPAGRAAHEITVEAPARDVYRLLADLANWPWLFRPFVHAEAIGRHDGHERVAMWTTTGDRVERWVALRRLDEAGLRIDFRPEAPAAPLASMDRSWVVVPLTDRTCTVRLLHAFTLTDGGPAEVEATGRIIDTVADAETAAVKGAAELLAHRPGLLVEVTDTVEMTAAPAAVYEALYEVGKWPGFLPHVVRAEILQDADDLQLVEVHTAERNGTTLAMRTARAGLPDRAIAYKQLVLPPIGASHTVVWQLEPAPSGTTVTSRQTVVLRPDGIAALLGDGKGEADAAAFVRTELSAKVRLVLDGVRTLTS